MTELTPEEITVLKELAQDLAAGNRLAKKFKSLLIWLSTAVGAGYVVWNFLLQRHP